VSGTEKRENIYFLHAVWQDEAGNYQHRGIHTTGKGPEKVLAAFISEHPEWERCDPHEVGRLNGFPVSVKIFHVKSSDEMLWEEWIRQQRQRRVEQLRKEERARDLNEIVRLVNKWGVPALEAIALAASDDSSNT